MADDASSTTSEPSHSKTVCLLCRQRKTKCNRELPACGYCKNANVDCEYAAVPAKRGLRAGYVSQLESRIKRLEHRMRGVERTLEDEADTRNKSLASMRDGDSMPSGSLAAPSAEPRLVDDAEAAKTDLATFSKLYLGNLAESWFRQNKAWLPIVDEKKLHEDIERLPNNPRHIGSIVLRAILALEIAYSSTAICLGYAGRSRLSDYLRSQAVSEAVNQFDNMESLRALYIISFLDFGADRIPQAHHVLGMCEQLAKKLDVNAKLYNMSEVETIEYFASISSSSSPAADPDVALAWCLMSWSSTSRLGMRDDDPSSHISGHHAMVANMDTVFSDSLQTHICLTTQDMACTDFYFSDPGTTVRAPDVQIADRIWDDMQSYTQGLPSSGYTVLPNGSIGFDINTIYTRLLANTTIIMVYQRLLVPAKTAKEARVRCLNAYDQIIDLARNITDIDTEISSPGMAQCFAAVARYHIVLQAHIEEPRHKSFDLLMHMVKMCGRRWPLARRLERVLRGAIADADGIGDPRMPNEFFDLKLSLLDISEVTKKWAYSNIDASGLASINGDYD